MKSIRSPYAIQQGTIPKSHPERYLTVVPLEWIETHPNYRWCLTSDVTHMVERPTAENAVHVLRATWDQFKRWRQPVHPRLQKPAEDIWDRRLNSSTSPWARQS